MPEREMPIALKPVSFGLMFVLLFLANGATRERRNDDAAHTIVEVERLSVSGREYRQGGLRQ